jgi:hypothetical protein
VRLGVSIDVVGGVARPADGGFVWGGVDRQEGEAERFETGDDAVQCGGVGERAGQRRRPRADLHDETGELVEDPGG